MRFSSFTYLVRQGLHNMRANRLMTFASMGVLTVCMILIGVAYLLGTNVDAIVEYIGEQNETIVYLQDGLTDEQIANADAAIRATWGPTNPPAASDSIGVFHRRPGSHPGPGAAVQAPYSSGAA